MKLRRFERYGNLYTVRSCRKLTAIVAFVVSPRRRKANREAAEATLNRLNDNRLLQSFLQEADELGIFLVEKTVVAQEETYDEARSLHGKWQKHQAFEAELTANKGRVDAITKVRAASALDAGQIFQCGWHC